MNTTVANNIKFEDVKSHYPTNGRERVMYTISWFLYGKPSTRDLFAVAVNEKGRSQS